MQHLELFGVHIRADIFARPLHRHNGQDLEQMVLHHVLHGACVIIVAAARLHADVLKCGDLHGFDKTRIPEIGENRVGEADGLDVPHHFLA